MEIENFIAGKPIKHSTGYTYFMPNGINEEWS